MHAGDPAPAKELIDESRTQARLAPTRLDPSVRSGLAEARISPAERGFQDRLRRADRRPRTPFDEMVADESARSASERLRHATSLPEFAEDGDRDSASTSTFFVASVATSANCSSAAQQPSTSPTSTRW